ncbi:replication-relaxation family protein [Nocardia acidivorans]|uniref:replication-relaxation family protein n=1 Tax=Nocardia acidivorans TaxID=404580 RepID=UPI0008326D30|nr:replication-relaxation family protein [Nocardia acidivorans]
MIARPTRQHQLRGLAPTSPALARQHARLAVCLTERDRWILRMCHEHRVLTTHQLTALGFGTGSAARRRLNCLRHRGVLDYFRPLKVHGSAPAHWVLAPAGAAVLAAEAAIEVRDLGYRADRALGIAHSLHLAHTLGINDWFTALATGPDPAERLLAWWSQYRCGALWGDLARPDGYGRFASAATTLDFFLEFDLGSMTLSTVAAKLTGYAELARTSAVITPVLFWTPTLARETALRKELRQSWSGLADPDLVPVATAAAELASGTAGASPAERLWLPLEITGAQRITLAQLASTWPRRTPVPASVPTPPTSRHAILAPPPPRPPETGGR